MARPGSSAIISAASVPDGSFTLQSSLPSWVGSLLAEAESESRLPRRRSTGASGVGVGIGITVGTIAGVVGAAVGTVMVGT